jgi:hypothetical protein
VANNAIPASAAIAECLFQAMRPAGRDGSNEGKHIMERPIDQALRDNARKRMTKMLDQLPIAASAGESSAEFLQRKRLEWDGRLIEVLE